MKYFTPKLLERIASSDDKVADQAQEEWERTLVRARRRWQKIKHGFPETVRRFEEMPVCLHDAVVLSMARQGDTLVMVLRLEPPSRDLVLLTFALEEEPRIDPHSAPGHGDGRVITWLYEEWDLDRRGRCWFEVLLSNAWSVRFPFRDFQFLILPQILPARDEQAGAGIATAAPRSA